MSISSWVLSIAGICVVSVLIDLFLPQGQMSGHIKTVFNFIIIFVIMVPIPNLVNLEIDSSTWFSSQQIQLQEDYIYQLNRDKLTLLEKSIEDSLYDNGMINIDISLSADIFTYQMQIETVYVDLSNLVIEKNDKHIDIENEVVKVITSFININEGAIVFSE